ncbi:phage major capsid protein [Acinetobacter baumannii]|uniref:Phage major capsid protein n=3 Tax=Acinetobacter TaxID=469 RepID=A0A6B2QFQ5_ACIBA|nr:MULTISPECIES: phage major capsid protein [Acinetobacter]EJB8516201.1 phage major capsid protein [Acinetobacter baumannii]MDA3451550.1 phage major capsid protein [Acinetobacter sp. AOR43_HL]MDC4642442.1 phage major capsid protein [Acinetobacter baumannii]NDN56634.1 phage major capsid protein [Acinetobacter baumannii]NDX03125.1 phage major capsid protein [Acinetobacter baumannii]
MNKYLKQLLDALAKKQAEKQGVITKALDDQRTPNEEEEGQITAIDEEIATIQKNIDRVKEMIKQAEEAGENGTPVAGGSPEEAANTAGGGNPAPRVEVESNLEKGVGFAKFVKCRMIASIEAKKGNYKSAVDVAKSLGEPPEVIALIEKATLGTTTDAGFASPLVHTNRLVGEYIELLRANTVLDKLQFRKVPFNVEIPAQATGSMTAWVGEGEAKPLTNPTYADVKVGKHKVAAIVVYTLELLEGSDPAVDVLIRDDLVASSAQFTDAEFLSASAGTTKKPAGLLNGVTPITSTGNTPEAVANDLRALRAQFLSNNLSLAGAYYLMSEVKAAELADMRDALGNTYFKGMEAGLNQKTLGGIPVIESETVGDVIILVKTSEILMADGGQVEIAYSDQATLVDGTTVHNLWQENKFAIRAERFVSWAKRRPIAASFIQYT